MTRTTALFDVHRSLGATFTDFAGWTMPVRYVSDLAEHHAVRRAAGLFDLTHMGEIEIVGPQAAEALEHAVVGRPTNIGVGRARYTMLCQRDGGIIDDVVVYRLAAQHFMVVANAGNTEVVSTELASRAAPFDAVVTNTSEHWALLAIQGPLAETILQPMTALPLADLKYYAISPSLVAGISTLVARTGYTGEDGFELYCRPLDAANLWRRVHEAGEPRGLVPTGLACRDTLRLEAGMPLYGHELDRSLTPFEAGLGRLVAGEKPSGFVGGTALAQRRAEGVQRTLVGLISHGRRSPRAGYAVLDGGGKKVGVVTSGAPSPTLGHPIALAYVTPQDSQVGTELFVDLRGAREAVQVAATPFYRRPD